MMKAIEILFLSLLFSIVLIGSVQANHEESEEPVCNSRNAFIEELGSVYNESAWFIGLINPFTGVELYVNEETGSWTLFKTNIQGGSCIIDNGYTFELLKK